jgi:hypothetical protein
MKTCQKNHTVSANVIDELPFSQRFPHRHKCAACAYELGLKKGYQLGLKEARKVIDHLVAKGILDLEEDLDITCNEPSFEGTHLCHS